MNKPNFIRKNSSEIKLIDGSTNLPLREISKQEFNTLLSTGKVKNTSAWPTENQYYEYT